jgi:hypothetical protein
MTAVSEIFYFWVRGVRHGPFHCALGDGTCRGAFGLAAGVSAEACAGNGKTPSFSRALRFRSPVDIVDDMARISDAELVLVATPYRGVCVRPFPPFGGLYAGAYPHRQRVQRL